MNKKIILIVASVLIVIGVALSFGLLRTGGHIPAFDYKPVYRLAPEKVSRSAAIRVEIPAASTVQVSDISKVVKFQPAISGHWLSGTEAQGAAVYDASQKDKVFYYKPDRSLEAGVHHDVILALANDQVIRSDFLSVPDPEVSAILPHGDDEVMTNTKISIVFNRPMVPLSTLDQYTSGNIPVTITPKTAGRYKWISTNTLQFIPDKGLISSAHYVVAVNAGFSSLEGLDVKPTQSSFSTLHLRFWSEKSDGFNPDPNINAVRGYNQPLLVRFNQPVDLDATKSFIKVSDGTTGSPVQFTLKYGSTQNDKGIMIEDQSLLAVYPASGDKGSWEPQHQYIVTVNRAYPRSGGDILISDAKSFVFSVDKIYSGLEVLSPRTNQASLDRFDPTGQLVITFYENIDLSKSEISGKFVDKVQYGEKCQERVSPCNKIQDRKRVLVSFKNNGIHPGDKIGVNLDSIVSDLGNRLTSKPLPITLSVYQPLLIYGIKSYGYLDRLLICSNNPIDVKNTGNKLSVQPNFVSTSWQNSYLHSDYSGNLGCNRGQFETNIYGYLLGQSKYQATVAVSDVFGQTAQGSSEFTS
ncbi:MAG: Ig-like domain-containing protein, partial [Candidatus Paceibacterota bacterium]